MQTYRDVKLPCQRVYDMYFRAAGTPQDKSQPAADTEVAERDPVQVEAESISTRQCTLIMKLNHTSEDSRVSSKSII